MTNASNLVAAAATGVLQSGVWFAINFMVSDVRRMVLQVCTLRIVQRLHHGLLALPP